LTCEYLREFSKKFETVLMGYSGPRGKLIHEINQKQKISWYCPFKSNLKTFSFQYYKCLENSNCSCKANLPWHALNIRCTTFMVQKPSHIWMLSPDNACRLYAMHAVPT
jgi:hypothetical protein